MPFVKFVRDYDINKENEHRLFSEKDLNILSFAAVNETFKNLGTGNDYKEWINASSL